MRPFSTKRADRQWDGGKAFPFVLRQWRVRQAVLVAACGVLTTAPLLEVQAAAQAGGKNFETIFSVKDEPASLHYQVTFMSGEKPHSLEVWRDGQARLRRKTDDVLDTFVLRDKEDPTEYQMTVVDYKRRITTQIDRNNLIRLGHFSDWFDLAHGLRHPVGGYELSASAAPKGLPQPVAPCRWYSLRQGQSTDAHRICWSAREDIPLVIWSEKQGAVWTVTKLVNGPIPDETFAMHDVGFVRNDANMDIEND